VRWHSVIPATAGGGTLAVVPVQDYNDILGAGAIAYSNLTTTPGTQFFDLRSEGAFVFKPKDNQFKIFEDVSTATTAVNPDSWNSVMLLVTGPATTTCINVEFYFHYEGLVDATVGISIGRAIKPNLPVIAALEEEDDHNGIWAYAKSQLSKEFERMSKEKAKQMIGRGIEAVGNYMVPGAGTLGRNGMLMLTNG
jgi:hypothetical protein